MYTPLLFHSFDSKKSRNIDPFYDISLKSFKKLLLNLSQKINPEEYTISFDDGYKSIKPAIKYASKLGFKTIAFIITKEINNKLFLSEKEIFDNLRQELKPHL